MTRVSREGPIHDAILRYLRLRFPRGLVVHAANELDMAGPAAARQVAKAKHRGMMPGWPDLMLLTGDGSGVPGTGELLCFEVKAPGGTVSPAQKGVLAALNRLGFRAAVVRSIRDVEECLSEWDVDGLGAWEITRNPSDKPQPGLRHSAAEGKNECGDAGAGNATHPLTTDAIGKGSRDGC